MGNADPIDALRARVAALNPAQRAEFRRQLEAKGIAWERVAPAKETASVTLPGRLPLTAAQLHFWIQQSLDPQSSAYHVAYRWQFDGPLDRVALEKAFQAVVERHEPLRTAFPAEDGDPWREVLPGADFKLEVVDLQGDPGQVEAVARAAAAEPFDLAKGPLIRARLLQLGAQANLLTITLHHIISDGWSRGVLMRELIAAYRAFASGETPRFDPLPRSFSDFAQAERQWLGSAEFARQRKYWATQLGGLSALEFPSDRSRHVSTDLGSETLVRQLPADLSAKAEALASRLGTTPFIMLAAAFKLLIHRYSGQRDVHLCVPVAGRQDPDSAGLIGLFTNTLVLRAQLDPKMSFADWTAHVQERFSDALDRQEFPFSMLAEAASLNRDARQSPLTQIMFQLQTAGYRQQNAEHVETGVSGLSLRQQVAPLRQTKVDLSWYVMARETGYALQIEYRTALFDAWRMEAMARRFEQLLGSIVAAPDAPLPTLDYLSVDERRELVALGAPAPTLLPAITVDQAISGIASRFADNVAISCYGRNWTYAELETEATALARHLLSMNNPVRPGDRVAVSMPGKAHSIVAFLAILKAGAIYVPLDPAHPADRLAYVLADAEVGIILTDEPQRYAGHRCFDPAAPRSGVAAGVALPVPDPARVAYLLYTSGSTGRPNGVPIIQESLLNHLVSMAREPGLRAGERMLAITTPTFDISILELLLPLSVGATVILYGPELLLAPARLITVLAEEGVTHVQATPAYWRMLLDAGWEGDRKLVALCGGEALDTALARRLLERTGELWNVYGPTEATIWATALRLLPCHVERGKTPIGGLLDNTHLHVLDAYGEPVPRGIPGELYIGGVCLSPGYWNRPALTATRFTPNPFHDPEVPRLYKTGDAVVRLDGEEIEFIGRTDFQVKLRGYRIETGEIEEALVDQANVEQAIVTLDAANERLVAYVLAVEAALTDKTAMERRLRQALLDRLPRYMVPTAFVLMSEFPLNPSGKVDRRRLPKPDAAPVDRVLVPARNAAEETLLSIWKEALRREDIGVEDNFFDLGGDSIVGVRIAARAQAKGLALAPMQIFEHQTVAAQALVSALSEFEAAAIGSQQWIVDEADEKAARLKAVELHLPALGERIAEKPADAVDIFELTPVQAGMLFHSLADPQSGTYFEQCWCVLDGALDQAKFVDAWRQVVLRHEVLRSDCHWTGLDRPLQVVYADAEPEWTLLDWSELGADAQDGRFAEWLEAERQRGFQLDRAPLLRFALIRLGNNRHRFVWAFHHLVMDGWCSALLVRDMLRAYAGMDLGAPPPPYRRYVEWRAAQDQDAASKYWREALEGATPTELVGFKGTEPDSGVHEIRESLDAGLVTRLSAAARRERVTLAAALQGAWALLLSRYGGQDDIVFGTVLAGRPAELPGADSMVGLFLNTVPQRVRILQDMKLADWLRVLQSENLRREPHAHAALTDINRWSGHRADPPLFESLLIVENIPLSMQQAFAAEGTGLTLSAPASYERTHYPLALRVFPGEETVMALTFDTARIGWSRAQTLLRHFSILLAAFADNMEARLDTLEIMDARERQAILAVGRGPQAEPAPLVHDDMMARAAETPDKIALEYVGIDGAVSWTYRELAARVTALAAGLAGRGVGRGSVVAVRLARGPDLVASLFAVMHSGAAYLPLDPDYPAERIDYMLRDCGASLLIGDRSQPASGAITTLDPDALAQAGEQGAPPPQQRGDDLAYILYTSGSTGWPKGVAIRHDALANFIAAMAKSPGIAREDRLLALTTVGFDIAGLELFGPLAVGATVVMADAAATRDGRRFVELVEQARPTLMQATPAGWRMLVEAGWRGAPTLRVLCGGEALPAALANQLLDRGQELWNLYGPTETTIWSAALRIERDMLAGASAPIAGPIDRTGLYVLDARGEPVPPGAAGELYISGAGLSPFYWGKPALTAEKFVPNPFAKSLRDGLHLYRTGDLVLWREDSMLDFLGRMDGQIKLRGFRIEQGEIEAMLTAHPAVAEAVVVVEEKQAGPRLVAWLRWAAEPVEAAMLRDHLASALPAYMIPALFSPIERFPLTPNGKVDRKALKTMRTAQDTANRAGRPLSGEVPIALAALWRKALEVDSVAPGDNFFDLGGHSLLVVSMQNLVREGLDIELPITDFFRFPTLETLAAHIAAMKGGGSQSEVETGRGEMRLAGRDRLAARRSRRN